MTVLATKHKNQNFLFKNTQEPLPEECIYADDADFVTTEERTKIKLNNMVKDILSEDNLQVNETKTEHTVIERCEERNNERWRSVKKLGSLLYSMVYYIIRSDLSVNEDTTK